MFALAVIVTLGYGLWVVCVACEVWVCILCGFVYCGFVACIYVGMLVFGLVNSVAGGYSLAYCGVPDVLLVFGVFRWL